MRTTLKKRARGAWNGNGRVAAEAPVAPPPPPAPGPPEPPLRVTGPPLRTARPGRSQPPPGPRSFYRVRRNPLKLLGKLVMWLLVAVLVAVGALAGGVKLYFDYSVAAIRPHSEAVIEAQELLEIPAAGQPAVAIVIGYDMRAGETEGGSRSDTIMLLRADPGEEAVTLLSFPRDMIVNIPGCRDQPSFRGRINEAYTYCGPRGTLATVKDLTGIPINYMITVNFRAFRSIVDKLDGVYMDVDRRYFNDNAGAAPGATYAEIDLKPGYQRLNGNRALDFVRYRHTDSDLYRVARQQEFVKAFKQQISSSWTLFQLPGIVRTITDNVEVAKGGGDALDPDEVISYARLAYGLPAGNFQQVHLEQLSGYNELSYSEEELRQVVQRFMNPDVSAPEKAIAVATGGKPKNRNAAPPPTQVTVEVLNGNGIAGSADDAAYLLGQIGYRSLNGGNAEAFDFFHTKVLYDPAVAGAAAAAKEIGDLFGDAEVEETVPGAGLPAMVRVVVGSTFTGSLGPAPRDTTPEPQEAAVVADRDSIVPLLQPLRGKVDFPILVPTVRERNSSVSTQEGVRAYKLGDHTGLRITYSTGTNEYWGIQQTSWLDAPILNGPTLERTIDGRAYRLYFSGSKLHMVAFERDGGAYWVVNTLLNRLSNETMLAIAAGLKPLRA
jgi:LCP family protein required for cell wall assembly